MIWQFDVGYTTKRPVIPDEHISRVEVLADTDSEAMCVAACMAMRPKVKMVTSSTYIA